MIISTSGSLTEIAKLNIGPQQSVYFEAPVIAPPCEVYNFSVIATPAGGKYSRSCSVHSSYTFPSWEPPSLPNITVLESSMSYSLERKSNKVVLIVEFHVS